MLTSLQPDTLPPSAPSQPRRGGGSLSGLDRHGLAEWSEGGETAHLRGAAAAVGRRGWGRPAGLQRLQPLPATRLDEKEIVLRASQLLELPIERKGKIKQTRIFERIWRQGGSRDQEREELLSGLMASRRPSPHAGHASPGRPRTAEAQGPRGDSPSARPVWAQASGAVSRGSCSAGRSGEQPRPSRPRWPRAGTSAPPRPCRLSRDGICAGPASARSSACPPRTSCAAGPDLGRGEKRTGPGSDLAGGNCAPLPLTSRGPSPQSLCRAGELGTASPHICFGKWSGCCKKPTWTAGPVRGGRLTWRRRHA